MPQLLFQLHIHAHTQLIPITAYNSGNWMIFHPVLLFLNYAILCTSFAKTLMTCSATTGSGVFKHGFFYIQRKFRRFLSMYVKLGGEVWRLIVVLTAKETYLFSGERKLNRSTSRLVCWTGFRFLVYRLAAWRCSETITKSSLFCIMLRSLFKEQFGALWTIILKLRYLFVLVYSVKNV